MQTSRNYDVIIIGSGAAGLTTALALDADMRIAVLSKARLEEGATIYAQGGIAAVLDNDDSIEKHCEDTVTAGAGLCHSDVVKHIVSSSTDAISWLIEQGVEFTKNTSAQNALNKTSSPVTTQSGKDFSEYHLTKEGGHTERRVIHSDDATGRAVSKTLVEQVKARNNIDCYEHHVAVDLVMERDRPEQLCSGVYVFDRENEHVIAFQSKFVVIATGGASKTYLYTSNPDGASGDGIAMAWRAGCRVANMEFNQFHPTCLYHPQAKSFLITEAVRGEGGILKLPDGSEFMHRFDARKELAPRDIVARAIDHEMKRLGADCLYLDISHRGDEFIKAHFPNIYETCFSLGIDITKEAIPVVPAAHYTCGGIVVDKTGNTDVSNVFAVGEASFTGLHGANRMASNSLLECIVYAKAAAQKIIQQKDMYGLLNKPRQWDESKVTDSDEDVIIAHNWDELRRFMWDYVGIVRTNKRLQRAQHRINLLKSEIAEYYSNYRVSNDLIELRNLVLVAELIIECALRRKESRGLHYTLNYPQLKQFPRDTVLYPPKFQHRESS